MNLRRLLTYLLFCLAVTTVQADKTSELRQRLPQLKGQELIDAYFELYLSSLSSNDIVYQQRCINDLIAEAHHQGDREKEGMARSMKIKLFYNNDLNDSIYEQTPNTLRFLETANIWDTYYEIWLILIETYNFDGKTIMGMDEAKKMITDAELHNNQYGIGLGHFALGLVYAMMRNHEEAANAYQKSVSILTGFTPEPTQLAEIFGYYSEVLDILKRYNAMNTLNNQWRDFLKEQYNNTDADASMAWGYYYMSRAQAELGLGHYAEATKMLDEVQKNASDDYNLSNMWLFFSAELYKRQHLYNEALAFNSQRLQLLDESSDPAEIIRVRKQRAEIFEKLGRFREAAQMYQSIYNISDSVNANDTKNKLAEMSTKFHVDELKLQQAEERARQQRLSIITIATIIVLALSIFIYFRLRSARRLKIAHQQLETTHQELLTAYDQLEETTIAKERIESDLRIARNIQMSMVPSTFPDRPDLDIYGSMTPAKEVGGDLYNFMIRDDAPDKLYFALGDVSGKGVPASLFMAQATRLFRTLAAQQMQPAEIATRMNDALSGDDNEQGMFVTMFLGVVDITTGHLQFCNAGHNPPILGTEFIEMIPNAPIGLFPGLDYEGEEIADIRGRQLFIYTDGLNEAENNEKDQFGDDHLLDIMATHHFESAKETIEYLKAEVEKHREGAEPNDDLTMLCFTVKS
ncbi:PP2C family protein-serine/threonine phosphatase [Xylanibacter ruminicola]|uniref:PP2C family protein-serine/threonine phosphatase n=1 Tax=Xylanibacter ruminicola TaxID=839 RepID=UPI001E52BF1A|nr:PP2C family protein-serine/threonine phosphatase [Xylanibacter ruminicola]